MNYGSLKRTTTLGRYWKQAPDGADVGGGGGGGPAAPAADAPGGSSPSGDGGGSSSVGDTPSTNNDTPADDPWSGIGSNDDLDVIEIPATPPVAPVVPPAPAQPVAPATPPVAAPATPQAPQPPTPPAPAQPEPAPLSPSDPVSIANAMDANRNEIIAHLATSKFALSQEEVQELEADVVTAVPKLMAKMYLESQMAMQKFLAQAVPGMIQNHTKATSANTAAENKFFDSNKHLGLDVNNAQHRQTAVRLARIYRQANPSMPLDQLISDVGPMVAMSLKLQPVAPGAPPSSAPGQPPTMQRGGMAFRPAVGGGGGASPAAAPENEWAGMGQNYEE